MEIITNLENIVWIMEFHNYDMLVEYITVITVTWLINNYSYIKSRGMNSWLHIVHLNTLI